MAYTLPGSVAHTLPAPGALAALAEPKRLEMLRLVWTDEMPAGRIAARFRVTFGAVSQHLAVLRRAGLVRARRAGRQIFYFADRAALGPLAPALEAMWSDKLATLKRLAEAEQRHVGAGRQGASRGTAVEKADEGPTTHVRQRSVRFRTTRTTRTTRTKSATRTTNAKRDTRKTRQTRQSRIARPTSSPHATHATRTRQETP